MRKNQRLLRTLDRALRLHAWVKQFQRDHHDSPSYADVANAFNMSISHVKHVRSAMVEFRLMWPVEPGRERAWPLKPVPRNIHAEALGPPSMESPVE